MKTKNQNPKKGTTNLEFFAGPQIYQNIFTHRYLILNKPLILNTPLGVMPTQVLL